MDALQKRIVLVTNIIFSRDVPGHIYSTFVSLASSKIHRPCIHEMHESTFDHSLINDSFTGQKSRGETIFGKNKESIYGSVEPKNPHWI